MLDILEDYARAADFSYERLDGDVTGARRQAAIDRYCDTSPGAPRPLLMLLSTRAGGVGITLVEADTVVLFDSDFNPQNDEQAMARCHRIGQTRPVKVYRLVAARTYEAKLCAAANRKL